MLFRKSNKMWTDLIWSDRIKTENKVNCLCIKHCKLFAVSACACAWISAGLFFETFRSFETVIAYILCSLFVCCFAFSKGFVFDMLQNPAITRCTLQIIDFHQVDCFCCWFREWSEKIHWNVWSLHSKLAYQFRNYRNDVFMDIWSIGKLHIDFRIEKSLNFWFTDLSSVVFNPIFNY